MLALRVLADTMVLTLASPTGAASQTPSRTDTPRIVIDGMEAYRRDGARAALNVWLKGSPAGSPGAVEQMIETLSPIEAAYGRVIGHDILRVVLVGRSVRRVYAIIKYERGPLYAYFDCYESPTGWIIPGFLSNTKPGEILPADLLSGERP